MSVSAQTDAASIGVNTNVQNFNGSVDEAIIFSTKLTADEITSVYYKGTLGVSI